MPEVGQLQCGADRIRHAIGIGIGAPGQPQHEPADGVGRAAAVVQHVVPPLVARRDHILTKGAEQIVEERQRQIELRARLRQRREDIVARRLPQVRRPFVEQREALVGGATRLIGDVVGAAGEGIDGGDVRSQVGGDEPRRDRKVLVVLAGDAEAGRRSGDSPLGLGNAGAVIGGARHHEQQVGHAIQVDADDRLHGIGAKGERRPLRPPTDRPRQVQRRPSPVPPPTE